MLAKDAGSVLAVAVHNVGIEKVTLAFIECVVGGEGHRLH
jgi:hypothetical protein